MHLSSTNVDNLRTKEAIGEFAFNCKTSDIDISCIQEKRNERNDNQTYGDYTIVYSASGKARNNSNNNTHWGNNWIGGVAIIGGMLFTLQPFSA